MKNFVLKMTMAVAGATCLVSVSAVSAIADTGTQSVAFTYSGKPETWQVPDGVTSIDFEVAGANGGGDKLGYGSLRGGRGADVMGTLAVTPGEWLVVGVGGNGDYGGSGGWGYDEFSGGVSNTATPGDRDGAAGGGASILANILSDKTVHIDVVAGGGGGAGGGASDPADNGAGGEAGCDARPTSDGEQRTCDTPSWAGGDGANATGASNGKGGKAASAPSPTGARGIGATGLGGNGGSGGGGYVGGGAGIGGSAIHAGGGAGAGSSWVDGEFVTNQSITSTDRETGTLATLKQKAGVILTYRQ